MRTTRTGYLTAMLAGVAIVGAATAGVSAATTHHTATLAADQASQLPATTAGTSLQTTGPQSPAAAPQSGAPQTIASSPAPGAVPASPTPATTRTPTTAKAPAATKAQDTNGRSKTTPSPSPRTTAPRTTAPATTAPRTTATTAPPTTAPPAAASKYRDGKYSATGSYNSPGGIEKLGVTVTLAADKVVTSDLDLLGGAGLSHSFQTAFASAYSPQVIGKSIDSISLGAVSGSSLTPLGFNDALKQIESQAKKP